MSTGTAVDIAKMGITSVLKRIRGFIIIYKEYVYNFVLLFKVIIQPGRQACTSFSDTEFVVSS